MKKKTIIFISLFIGIFVSNIIINRNVKDTYKQKAKKVKQPIAKKTSEILEKFGDRRTDNYFWMKDRDSTYVLDYLKVENAYNDSITAHTKTFQKLLFEEMKSRIKEKDESVPFKDNGYWYITKYIEGKDYPIYVRKKETLEAKEELLFDCNEMEEGHSYFNMGSFSVSPDNKLVAFAIDTIGRREYVIKVKQIKNNVLFPNVIKNTDGGCFWANDNNTFFYTRKNAKTLRSEKIFKHKLDENKDSLVFYEKDETFSTFVYRSKSNKYIIIGSESTLTSEYRFVSADMPDAKLRIVQKRMRGVEYGVYHFQEHFYILTNIDDASNFKLMKTQVEKPAMEFWEEVIPHRENTLIEDVDIFNKYLVLTERTEGLEKIRVINWKTSESYYIPFKSETYTVNTTRNVDIDTDVLRYSFNSLTTPNSIIDFKMTEKTKEVKKEQEVLGGMFDKANYFSERKWAISRDGTKIPMSIVYKKGKKKKNGKNPLLIYGYGSYGYTIDPYFSSVRLSLLDRGFIFVIAHIRGGEYMGRKWYEDGKLLNKKNTFYDFIDCTKYLIDNKYTKSKHCYAMGGSAGGLLMGAIVNMAPELYNGIISAVPFVDVLTTMLDESIPLTTGEYDEWGNPNEKKYYDYIKSYSPYDNIKNQKYPNILVTTGYHDSQVQYWEPAKWIAKLRENKKDKNILLFHTNFDAGHSGSSGRFEALKEVAEKYAFILNLERIVK